MIAAFLKHNKDSAAMGIIWDALRAHFRGLLIRQISSIKASTKEWVGVCLCLIRLRKLRNFILPIPHRILNVAGWKLRLYTNKLCSLLRRGRFFFLQQRYFEEGESIGHLLGVLSCSQQAKSHIDAIRYSTGVLIRDLEQMPSVFKDFYQDVYSSKVDPTEVGLMQFLDQCPLPTLSPVLVKC